MSPKSGRTRHNVIRFPTSPWERRRLLRESKDIRVRVISTLRTICGWLLLVSVFLFLLSNYQLFTPSAMRSLTASAVAGLRQQQGDASTISYENDSFTDAALFNGGLAYADSDALFLAKPGGTVTLRLSLGYTSPVIETCSDYVLVYDRGGTQATLANSLAAVTAVSPESPIITGSIAENGYFTLITDETGYRTAVAVYNTAGKEIFKYQSSEYYIVSAALDKSASTLAVLAFQQDGVTLNSHLLLYDISSGDFADALLSDSLGMDVCYLSGSTAAVLSDDGLYLVNRKGEAEHVLTVASSDLLAFSVQDGALALATRSYEGSARCDLYTVYENGELNGPYSLSEEPAALSISDEGVAILTSSGASVYDKNVSPLWHNSEAVGARRVLLSDDGTLFAVYAKNTRLYTAHSAQSEDISDAT